MDFITIQHKDGAITVDVDQIDYISYNSKEDLAFVTFRQLPNVFLTKEQHDMLLDKLWEKAMFFKG